MLKGLPWPSRRTAGASQRLAIHAGAAGLAWVQADAACCVQRAGIEPLSIDQDGPELGRRLRALGLPAQGVTALLALDEAQLLQIEAPAVKPEEMRSAARWRIKDLVDARLDELTIDVMPVGHDKTRHAHQRQMFVVAARHALIQNLSRRVQALGLGLAVIDVAEMAQRNLQHAAAVAEGIGERASALLMRHGERALLTLVAGGELYHARALEWEARAAPTVASPAQRALPADLEQLDFIDYGAESAGTDEAPRLVVEVQRSLDLWERTWPQLPLARLWVHAGEEEPALTAQLAVQLARALSVEVRAFDAGACLPGLSQAAPHAALRQAALPLAGALRRHLS
jgi:MSHA biogenesis protein MshI